MYILFLHVGKSALPSFAGLACYSTNEDDPYVTIKDEVRLLTYYLHQTKITMLLLCFIVMHYIHVICTNRLIYYLYPYIVSV